MDTNHNFFSANTHFGTFNASHDSFTHPFHLFQLTYHTQKSIKFKVRRSGELETRPPHLFFLGEVGGSRSEVGGFNYPNPPGKSDPDVSSVAYFGKF